MARPLLAALVLAATLASLVPPLASQATTCESARRGHHQYRQPVGVRRMVVDASGAGDFLSIQQAVDSVPVNNSVRVIMQINAGIYIEKVVVPASKPYITLEGAGRDVTVVEWHDKASDRGPDGQQLRTYNTASVTVLSNYFTAKNISFKNTAPAPMPGMQGGQAVAFRVSGDKAFFFGCGFYGAQDTLCDDAGRHYFRDCYIEGSIDFIFGNGRSLYKVRAAAFTITYVCCVEYVVAHAEKTRTSRTASCTRRRGGSGRWRRTGGRGPASAPASRSSTAG
ncbi:hypothetical protein VPH35_022889 [Triticum aestivum]